MDSMLASFYSAWVSVCFIAGDGSLRRREAPWYPQRLDQKPSSYAKLLTA